MLHYFGVDCIAMCLTFSAIYLLGNKTRKGFAVMMLGNLLWCLIGLWAQSYAMILANLGFFTMKFVASSSGLHSKRVFCPLALADGGGTIPISIPAARVHAVEALTAVSLILGLLVGLWGWIGALQFLNLWLGLYNDWYEWPWTFFFALVLQVIFALHHYGRSLGVDAILTARPRRSRLLDWVS